MDELIFFGTKNKQQQKPHLFDANPRRYMPILFVLDGQYEWNTPVMIQFHSRYVTIRIWYDPNVNLFFFFNKIRTDQNYDSEKAHFSIHAS